MAAGGAQKECIRKLAERNATDTLAACGSGIIRFQEEGGGCVPCEQFPEGLAHGEGGKRGGTRRGASGAPKGLTEMLLFCFLQGHDWALSSPEPRSRAPHVLGLSCKAKRGCL